MSQATTVTIEAGVKAPLEKVWEMWNGPEHVMQWNSASPDWHSPAATNDPRPGGAFSYRMEAKDGSFGFDFAGTYDEVRPGEYLAYTLGDGRKVTIAFTQQGDTVHIRKQFEAEGQNPVEMQEAGWQAILDSFKRYAESNS